MSYSDTAQGKLVSSWAKGFEDCDLETIGKHLTSDFTHQTYPRSLNHPNLTKEAWIAKLTKVFSLRAKGKTIIHSVTETPGKVITHFTNETTLEGGITHAYEAITITHIVADRDGSLKIKEVEEFVDSKTLVEFMSRFNGGN